MKKRVSRKVNSYTKERIKEIVRKICNSYETGEYTLESCCKNAGVPYRTFKDWWARYEINPDDENNKWYFLAEVAGLWENSKRKHRNENEEALMHKAESLLMKAITGYEYEEIITIYRRSFDSDGNVTLVPVGFRKKKRFHPPSVSAIIFVLTKLKPEIYGQRTLILKENLKSEYDNLTVEEIEAEIQKIKSKS